jgi:hypothetical protein
VRLIPAQEKQIVRLYTDKVWPWSLTQLASAYGITASGVNKVLDRHGVTKRPRGIVLAHHRSKPQRAEPQAAAA